MKRYKQIGKLRPLLVGVGPHSWTLVVLSSSHARNSHALARENGACFIFIRRLFYLWIIYFIYLFTTYYLWELIYNTNLPISYFFYFIHASFLIIFKLCINAKSISLRHKNYNSSIVIDLKSLHFAINLLPKLLSASFLWNNSISQSHPKL